MSNYAVAAVAYAIVTGCLLYGAWLFVHRHEHARTAFSLMLTWAFLRGAMVNWIKAGHGGVTWLATDQATALNAVMLASSCVMFMLAERHKVS